MVRRQGQPVALQTNVAMARSVGLPGFPFAFSLPLCRHFLPLHDSLALLLLSLAACNYCLAGKGEIITRHLRWREVERGLDGLAVREGPWALLGAVRKS